MDSTETQLALAQTRLDTKQLTAVQPELTHILALQPKITPLPTACRVIRISNKASSPPPPNLINKRSGLTPPVGTYIALSN